jgi:hypothetical protein
VCYALINETDISVYNPFTMDELSAMNAFLTALMDGSFRGHPSMNPNCSYNTTWGYPLVPLVKVSTQEYAPDDLLEMMRRSTYSAFLCTHHYAPATWVVVRITVSKVNRNQLYAMAHAGFRLVSRPKAR